MDRETRLKRLHFRSRHRGTREADYLVGGFFDAHGAAWNDAELGWFEALIDEQDVDILSWAFGRTAPPPHLEGPLADALRRLDYVKTMP